MDGGEAVRNALRLRLSEDRWIDIRIPAAFQATDAAVQAERPRASPRPPEPSARHFIELRGERTVIALVEAVPSGADELGSAIVRVLEAAGLRVGVICLDRQNRMGARLGCPTHAPSWCWRQATPDLLLRHGLRVVVPGPATENEVGTEVVEAVLHLVREAADIVLVDLGCRWEPKLFRPIIAQANQIWVMVRSGQWTGAEMRLEQAECSGWTEMRRVRLVAVGEEAPPPINLGVPVAGHISVPDDEAARYLVERELGRVSR